MLRILGKIRAIEFLMQWTKPYYHKDYYSLRWVKNIT